MSNPNPVNLVVDGSLTTPVYALSATASTSLTKAQNGAMLSMPTATGNTVINLPAPFIGAHFKFIVAAASNGANTQTITSTGANMQGSMLSITGAAGANVFSLQANKTTITLSATAANTKVGDYVDITSVDGVSYQFFAFSQSAAAAAWTFA